MQRLLSLSIFVFLLLTGCTTLSPTTSTPPAVKRTWVERQKMLTALDRFQLSGKIAFRSAQDAGSATLNWKENKGQYTVSLFGPLGSNNVTLIGQNGSVTMETANGKKVNAASPEDLVKRELGYRLPISYLKYWIKGIPVGNLPAATKFDAYQRLSQLDQAGWQVNYSSYTNVGNLDVPNRISINSRDMQAKIIIYHWQY